MPSWIGGERGPSQKAKAHNGPIRCLVVFMAAARSAVRPRKTKPRAQNRFGQPTIPCEPSDLAPRYHPSASVNARNPDARSPAKGGLQAVESTTMHKKRSATSNKSHERTARTAQWGPGPAIIFPRKKYQISIPTESMMQRESRKVMRVIPLVVELTRSSRAQTKSK